MNNKMIDLEIKEELMIYIANNLPFIAKGSFLTYQYHKDPLSRLMSGGDIDLIYDNSKGILEKRKIDDFDHYDEFIQDIETLLKCELINILYKLEEIMMEKLNLIERPGFILELEGFGYRKILRESDTIQLYLVNYASDGDFTTVGIKIYDPNLYAKWIEIDIALNIPIRFQPETILYKTMTGKEVTLKNTTPLVYQTAWKIHQILVRPRFKDLDDVTHFLPHIDFEDRHTFERFFDEIISECKLSCIDGACRRLIHDLTMLFKTENAIQVAKMLNIFDDLDRIQYYSNLYGIPCQIEEEKNSTKNTEKLEQEICSCFLRALHNEIDCNEAIQYIGKTWYIKG